MLIFYRLLISMATATVGTAFARWFLTTSLGRWFQTKLSRFNEHIAQKYDIELVKKEDKWRRDYPLLAGRIDSLEKKVKIGNWRKNNQRNLGAKKDE